MDISDERVSKALAERDIEALRQLREKISIFIFRTIVIDQTIEKDDLPTLSFLYDHNFMINELIMEDAIEQGAFKIVKFLLAKGCYTPNSIECSISHSLEMTKLCIDKIKDIESLPIPLAANVDVLTYLYEEKGIRFDIKDLVLCILATKIDLLTYIVDKCENLDLANINILTIAINQAQSGDGYDIIRYLLDKGFQYDTELSLVPAKWGYLEIIKILHEKGYTIHEDAHSSYEHVNSYLHKHHLGIYRTCDITCKKCYTKRMNDMIELWYLEKEAYEYLHQWLPREMVEDLIELCNNEHYYHIQDNLDNDYMNEEYEIHF